MVLHDFPWGNGKADWDVQLTQNQYSLRVQAIEDLNENENAVSFALCSFKDISMVCRAFKDAGYKGDYVLVVDKVNKVEKTKQAYGIIEHCQPAVVAFKGKQSDAPWNFTDELDERKQRWPVSSQKQKVKGLDGKEVNFSEQPLEIDFRAISHWSRLDDWVFADGFGSGTSLVAALRAGRSAVGTEPDPVQFEAASQRLLAAINQNLLADAAALKRRTSQARVKKAEERLAEKKERLEMRKKNKRKPKRKHEDEEDEEGEKVCCCLFSLVCLG